MEGCTMRKPPVSRGAVLAAGSARGMGAAGGAAAVRGMGAVCNVAAADGAGMVCDAGAAGGAKAACDTDAAGLTSAGNGGRRRIDPRVSLAVLLLLNATAFAPKLVGVQVLHGGASGRCMRVVRAGAGGFPVVRGVCGDHGGGRALDADAPDGVRLVRHNGGACTLHLLRRHVRVEHDRHHARGRDGMRAAVAARPEARCHRRSAWHCDSSPPCRRSSPR